MNVFSLVKSSEPVRFVALTFALSWLLWLVAWTATGRPATFAGAPIMTASIYAGSFAPGLAAAILSASAGRTTLKAWALNFVRLRCDWRAYAAALLPVPLALLLLTVALGYTPRPGAFPGLPPIAFYLTLFPVSIVNGLATALLGAGPLGEEGGWRGYLLPRLLARGGEVRASLIIGMVWALWHLPIMAMFPDWRSGIAFAAYLPLYTAAVIALSFVFTRVWLIGGGSLVPCIWLHGLVNAVGGVAFDQRVWASRWSPEAGVAHGALAIAIVAGLLLAARGRTRPAVAFSSRAAGPPDAPQPGGAAHQHLAIGNEL